MKAPKVEPPVSEDSPGVPGFRRWRGIYIFVFAFFALVVLLLALFTRYFA